MAEPQEPAKPTSPLVSDHSRLWRKNRYVYPVISRRSRGLSIGVNLNPDTVCNFDCIYCQVDRTDADHDARVDLAACELELDRMLASVVSGEFFAGPPFGNLPPSMRVLRDVAFSGDAEPTACPQFLDAVRAVTRLKAAHALHDTKIILLTNAAYLRRPKVRRALELMDANRGEIWAKLDAGTEHYYRLVNRPNLPLTAVLENILDAARCRPLVIQSLWMKVRDRPPPDDEVHAFADRLNRLQADGGRIKLVQVYTVARRPAEDYVTPLDPHRLQHVAGLVRRHTGLDVAAYFAPET